MLFKLPKSPHSQDPVHGVYKNKVMNTNKMFLKVKGEIYKGKKIIQIRATHNLPVRYLMGRVLSDKSG